MHFLLILSDFLPHFVKTNAFFTSIALCLLLATEGLFAQHRHEFSIYSGGGFTTPDYKSPFSEQKFDLGGHFGLGYHLFFSPKWGLGTGTELATYNTRFKIDSLKLLQIPLKLQFQTGKKRQFFMDAGGKVGIPLKGSSQTTLFASAETGVKWRLSHNFALYTGAYLDYGLTQYTQNKFSSITTPVSAGVKLRLTLGKKRIRLEAPQAIAHTSIIDIEAEEAQRLIAEEAARKAAETKRLAQEEEARRRAAEEKARQEAEARLKAEEAALNAAKKQIELPIDHYSLSQTELTTYQKQRLDEKIALLQKYPYLRVYIYGHTCNAGTKEINERIGYRRASLAEAYMVSNGIAESRILGIASKGYTEPVAPNNGEENRQKNRRVQLVAR
ncbi:MAG: OmpA family protein [Bacteroidales bacterium]|nr:OmpA family protein [Bacteroidales bacterium]